MDNHPDMSQIPDDECAVCGSYEIAMVDTFGYPFCAEHEHRFTLLDLGHKNGWPPLRIVGVTDTYAIDGDWQAYILSAFFGTDERVIELIDALDEYQNRQAKAS